MVSPDARRVEESLLQPPPTKSWSHPSSKRLGRRACSRAAERAQTQRTARPQTHLWLWPKAHYKTTFRQPFQHTGFPAQGSKNSHRRLAQAPVAGSCFEPPGRILELLTRDPQHSGDSLPLPTTQFRRHSQQLHRSPQLAHLGGKTLLAAPLVAGLRPSFPFGCIQRRLEVRPPEALLPSLGAGGPFSTAVLSALLQAPVAGHRHQALTPVGDVTRRVEGETVSVNSATHHPNRKTGTRLAFPVMVAQQLAGLAVPFATRPPTGNLGNQSSLLVRVVGRDHKRVAAACMGGSFVANYCSIFRSAEPSSTTKWLGIPLIRGPRLLSGRGPLLTLSFEHSSPCNISSTNLEFLPQGRISPTGSAKLRSVAHTEALLAANSGVAQSLSLPLGLVPSFRQREPDISATGRST